MFSGKTSELIRRIQRYHLASYRCLIIKHSIENKLSSKTTIVSHDGNSLPAIYAVNLKDIGLLVMDFDVVGIDEGHSVSFIIYLCKPTNKLVTLFDSGGIVSCYYYSYCLVPPISLFVM